MVTFHFQGGPLINHWIVSSTQQATVWDVHTGSIQQKTAKNILFDIVKSETVDLKFNR